MRKSTNPLGGQQSGIEKRKLQNRNKLGWEMGIEPIKD
jgi:hypothetical protein